MPWDLGQAASFADNGTDFWWWLVRGILWDGFSRFSGDDLGVPTYPQHFQCGGGNSGASLYIFGGRRIWSVVRVGKGGAMSHRIFMRMTYWSSWRTRSGWRYRWELPDNYCHFYKIWKFTPLFGELCIILVPPDFHNFYIHIHSLIYHI